MRIGRHRNTDPPSGSFRQGQIVRGRVVADRDGQYLLQGGKRIPVRINGEFPAETARFMVSFRDGEMVLAWIRDQAAEKKPASGGNGRLPQILSALRGKAPGKAGHAAPVNRNATLPVLAGNLLPESEAEKVSGLLRFYLDSVKTRKKAFNRFSESAENDKEELRFLLESLSGRFTPVRQFAGEASGRKQEGKQREQSGRSSEFFFMLLPLSLPDGKTDFVPLLVIGDSGAECRSWIFSECGLEALGQVRIVLFSRQGHVGGEVFCEETALPLVSEVVTDARIRVKGGKRMGDFDRWPLEVLAEGRSGSFDGQV